MPSKNVIKEYEPGGYYHLYNRGVDKRTIFITAKDYKTFLSYLELYLIPSDLQGSSLKVSPSRKLKNFHGDITLLSYCLMPNHFHLMVRQNSERGIDHFMRCLSTKYVRYFNSRYKRIGPLFQGIYKAVRITSEHQFTYLSKYIHRNPLDLPAFKDAAFKDDPRRLQEYPYSSYGNYLKRFQQTWVSTDDILSYFSKINPRLTYRSFVEESEPDDISYISKLALDLE